MLTRAPGTATIADGKAVYGDLEKYYAPRYQPHDRTPRGYIGEVEGANVVKFNRRQPKISYLSYPAFDRDPHPALLGALVVQLQTFQVHYFDYSTSESPAILHRKEAFVSADYPLRAKFERLTRQEERWGLYENPSTIGTKHKWDQLLAKKSVRLAGHRITRIMKGIKNTRQHHFNEETS